MSAHTIHIRKDSPADTICIRLRFCARKVSYPYTCSTLCGYYLLTLEYLLQPLLITSYAIADISINFWPEEGMTLISLCSSTKHLTVLAAASFHLVERGISVNQVSCELSKER